jgi:hypothetical protein
MVAQRALRRGRDEDLKVGGSDTPDGTATAAHRARDSEPDGAKAVLKGVRRV